MIKTVLTGAIAWLLLGSRVLAQSTPDPVFSSAQNSVKLSGLYIDLPAGDPWLSIMRGSVICFSQPVVQTWKGGREAEKISSCLPAFKTALEGAGYKVVTPGKDDLFDKSAGTADYEVAGVISAARVNGCTVGVPNGGEMSPG
jgi:hypothetical protein